MSLYFKWSCDFHRFTKSKTLRISGSHYTRFLKKPSQAFSMFNLQGTIRCFRGLFRTFRSSLPFSVAAYLLYQVVFSLSRSVFNCCKLFSTRAASFRSSLFSISNSAELVKKFFQLFVFALFDRLCTRDLYSITRFFTFVNSFFRHFLFFGLRCFSLPAIIK